MIIELRKFCTECGHKVETNQNNNEEDKYNCIQKINEMLEEYSINIQEFIDDFLNGDDETRVEAFSEIKYNNDYSEFNIYVDSQAYTMFDMMYAIAFYIQGRYYQIFKGVSPQDIDVEVNFIYTIFITYLALGLF